MKIKTPRWISVTLSSIWMLSLAAGVWWSGWRASPAECLVGGTITALFFYGAFSYLVAVFACKSIKRSRERGRANSEFTAEFYDEAMDNYHDGRHSPLWIDFLSYFGAYAGFLFFDHLWSAVAVVCLCLCDVNLRLSAASYVRTKKEWEARN
jgi:hypothetical protein